MSLVPPRCPLCQSEAVQPLGKVAAGDFFAGCVLEQPVAGGRLWRCVACESMFKHPVLSAGRYAQLYAQGRAEQWSGARRRCDFELAAGIIARDAPDGPVLDVGCGTGEWLSLLPSGRPRAGIEPSTAAASLARERGVQILGADLRDVPAAPSFAAVTLIDVIEHATDVPQLLQAAAAHLRPGGLLLVSTGDANCLVWRGWFGSRFWYASFPEHLVFPSRSFLERWGAAHALLPAGFTAFRYHALGIADRWMGRCLQAAYALSPWAFSLAGRLTLGSSTGQGLPRQHYSPGVPGAFRDHQLVVLRKAG